MLLRYFGEEQVIVNVGRDLMFPRGSSSTKEDQREAARFYRTILQDIRTSKKNSQEEKMEGKKDRKRRE